MKSLCSISNFVKYYFCATLNNEHLFHFLDILWGQGHLVGAGASSRGRGVIWGQGTAVLAQVLCHYVMLMGAALAELVLRGSLMQVTAMR